MRRLLAAAAVCVAVLAAVSCGPKVVPVPTVTAPKYPDFIKPAVPPALAGSPAALSFDRGWLFLQAGDFRSADAEFGQALKQSPEFYPAEAAEGYLNLARKQPKDAVTHFDRALQRNAADVSSLVGRGEALVALDRAADAIPSFEAALAADASMTDLRRRVDVMKFRLAETDVAAARQAARAGRLDEAIAGYRVAVEHSPDSAFLYRELAGVERQKGDVDLALEHFRKAVSLDPGDASSLAQIGELLEQRNEIDAAAESYAASLAIEPNDAVEAKLNAIRTKAALDKLPQEYRAIDSAPQITRADLAALVGIRLAPVLQNIRGRDAVLITDVRNSWAETWIMAVAKAGIIDAYANHAFQPRAVVRRVDLAQTVSRLLSKVVPPAQYKMWQAARPKLADVPPTHLAYPAVSVAVASGMLPPTETGAFQMARPVTGQEAIDVINRIRQLANLPQQADLAR